MAVSKEEELLGDQITRLAEFFKLNWPMKELERIWGIRCGCEKRRQALNELHKRVQNYAVGRKVREL